MTTTSAPSEVLPPALTKGEARSLETLAKRHYRTANRNAVLFAAELRRLQDGEAHRVRGFDQFGDYVEHTFDGLSATAARQVSRQGDVALRLERHDRIDMAQRGGTLPGATALRALSVVLNDRGERDMLAVYDRATELRPERAIAEATVKQALRELAPPSPPVALAAPVVADEDQDDEEDQDGALVEEAMDPEDQLDDLRQYRDDLDELITARSTSSTMTPAQRRDALDHVEYMRRRLDALAAQLGDS
jgi:hypothetical protein